MSKAPKSKPTNGKQTNGKPKRKHTPARKAADAALRVLDDKKRAQIIAIISVGCSRQVAASFVGVGRATIDREIGRNAAFGEEMDQAAARCEVALVRKLSGADDWRAALAMLARRFPERWSESVTGSFTMDHGLKVEEDEGWYGNKAHERASLAAQGAAASSGAALVSGTVQSDALRPALGQNGDRTNGDGAGPRTD